MLLNAAVPGRALGRYELLLPLARGGMAQVWAARLCGTRGFQKIVAIKTILAEAMDGTRAEQMFLEEATLASQIHHPNVVGTLELGEHEGTLYLVMEWVHGEPVSQILLKAASAGGGVPMPIALNLIGQAGKGLHAAHEARDEAGNLLGVVHRDVSPHNILVGYNGTAKLVDFGIAKATARASELTNEGELKGKFAYMAPEQVSGKALDRRADIFGLGVLLYTLTTGRHPFRGDSAGETLRNICVRPPKAPHAVVPGYPPALEAVVLRALAKSPDERWPTAYDFVAALEAAVPESLGSREGEVSEYMRQLFGERANERMNEIRLAQQLADRTQSGTAHSSGSSLRAVSLDQVLDAGAERAPQESAIKSDRPPLAAVPPRHRKLLPVAAAVALVAVGALAFGVGRLGGADRGSGPTSAGRLDSDARAPQAAPTLRAAEPAAPVSTKPTTAAQPAESVAAAGSARASEGSSRGRPPHSSPAGLGKRTAPVAEPAPPPAPAPALERPAVDAGSPRKLNAWNADNYGGRL